MPSISYVPGQYIVGTHGWLLFVPLSIMWWREERSVINRGFRRRGQYYSPAVPSTEVNFLVCCLIVHWTTVILRNYISFLSSWFQGYGIVIFSTLFSVNMVTICKFSAFYWPWSIHSSVDWSIKRTNRFIQIV